MPPSSGLKSKKETKQREACLLHAGFLFVITLQT
jgi:hypothetical protein